MVTDKEKNDIAQTFLTALRNHDWELMRSIMINEVIWSLPGTSLISGDAYGIDAVIKRSQLIVNYKLNFGLKNILFGQHGVALSLNLSYAQHLTARRASEGWWHLEPLRILR
jgi:uncharacterized protein